MTRKLPPLPSALKHAELPIVLAVLLVLRQYGLVARVNPWEIVVVMVGAIFLADAGSRFFPMKRSNLDMWCSVGALTIAITAVMYVTGWGPMLAVGYAYAAGAAVNAAGAKGCKAAALWAMLCLAGGEWAIQSGLAPSFVKTPEVHGLAVLAALGLVIVMRVLYRSTVGKERAELEVRQSEERFRALVTNASDIIIVFQDPGTATYVSPAFERVMGLVPEADFFRSGNSIHPDDIDRTTAFFAEVLATPGEPIWTEARLRDVNGDWHWFEVGMTNRHADPNVEGIVANLRDVTERKLFEEQLSYQAYHDSLTGLPNRAAFLQRLETAIGGERDEDTSIAVLFLDVDRFKLVNDSLGHEVGDRLLIEVADRLRSSLRPGDTVARFGGDEFTILLTGLYEPDAAVRVAERILDQLRAPVAVGSRELFITSSIGIVFTSDPEHAGDLLREADLAMYLAKEKGRARWELFDKKSAPAVVERLELEGDLWRAVDEGELVVHFQPEVSLDGGEVVAVEALVRWNHPERGMLLPASFIPFAEESSLILAVDRFVLRRSCLQAKEWQSRADAPPLRVSINLSPRFVRQMDAGDDIMSIVRETGVDPHNIQLEITERTALTDEQRTVETLNALREYGIKVAIDDFGTGYSSLSYLKRFPIDTLKLDKSFVDGICSLETDAAIVEAVITMGHALGMRITAEGVERPEQAARLRQLGCDTAQGFLFAHALAPDAVDEMMRENAEDVGGTVVPMPIRRTDTAG
ncbi:MAG TPA: EAL domain-containing protein [Acidimicrobiia bacterium]